MNIDITNIEIDGIFFNGLKYVPEDNKIWIYLKDKKPPIGLRVFVAIKEQENIVISKLKFTYER